jgi:hypothetical protein
MSLKIKHLLILAMLIVQVSCEDWLELIPPEGLIREEEGKYFIP